MLRTRLCELFGIDHPIIQAGMGPFGSGARLAAAVSNAGAIGSLGGAARTKEGLRKELEMLRELTDRPFIVNFTQPWLQQDPEALDVALEAKPPVISFSLGDPGELVKRVHDAGALCVQQITTVEQALQMAERDVDVIIAQGTEAGGFTGEVAASVLVPQVVGAVAPIPVVAAGGIADGRGLAAVLVLGAVGANMGTRFLASKEASISESWKKSVVYARSQDAVKAEVWDDIFPKPEKGAFDVVPRSLRTPFIEKWEARREEAAKESEQLQQEIWSGLERNEMEKFFPFTGQGAGLIDDILPAGEIVGQLIRDAEDALRQAQRFII